MKSSKLADDPTTEENSQTITNCQDHPHTHEQTSHHTPSTPHNHADVKALTSFLKLDLQVLMPYDTLKQDKRIF